MGIKGLLFLVFIPLFSLSQKENTLNKNFVLGRISYKEHPAFIQVASIHSNKSIYLDKEVYQAFKRMYEQAKIEHISLKIISGTRNFDEQKAIWERKWKTYKHLKPIDRAKKILEYSSMPSSSRHHWGTDIDINSLNNTYFEKGTGKLEYNWLVNNAHKFGFYQVYTNKTNGRTGYNLECWHWSYLPLANTYLNFYKQHITYLDIKGFSGSHLAESLHIISDYVCGISKQAKTFINN